MLRVEIAGRWNAKDFSEFYDSMNTLYSLFSLIEIEQQSSYEFERLSREFFDFYPPGRSSPRRFRYYLGAQRALAGGGYVPIDPAKFRDATTLLEDDEQLAVRRCEYASPGVTDFAGMGQALGHVKDIVLKCIDVWVGRRERELKNEILEHQRDAEALKNVRERLSILKSLGYSETHCRQILAEVSPAVAKLEALTQRGLITNASDIENDG